MEPNYSLKPPEVREVKVNYSNLHYLEGLHKHLGVCYIMKSSKHIAAHPTAIHIKHITIFEFEWWKTLEGHDYWSSYNPKQTQQTSEEILLPDNLPKDLDYALSCLQSILIRNIFKD